MEKSSCRLPPSENGEWWEIGDESRGGIPYYYHTKTGETVWEKPDGFVIPLTVLQVRPLSLSIRRELKRPPLEYCLGSSSLQVISFNHGSGSDIAYTCNGTGATPCGSPFTFTQEGSPGPCSCHWSASVFCKRSCSHHQKELERSPCATQPCRRFSLYFPGTSGSGSSANPRFRSERPAYSNSFLPLHRPSSITTSVAECRSRAHSARAVAVSR